MSKIMALRGGPPPMTEEELKALLSQPLTANIATVKKDGSPTVTPVWFLFDGAYLYVNTSKDRAKLKNIKHENRVAVTIESQDKQRAVLLEGIAEVFEDNDRSNTVTVVKKYVRAELVESALTSPWMVTERVIIRVRPKTTITWDFAKIRPPDNSSDNSISSQGSSTASVGELGGLRDLQQ